MYSDALQRAQEYARRRGLSIEKQLGSGVDGIVLSTSTGSAIKALRYKELYERERDAYLRLQEKGVDNVAGFSVPKLIGHHDELWVVEMQIVSPPFIVDFAGARLDAPTPFPPEVLEQWRGEKLEQFGEQWEEVLRVLSAFRRYGIYLSDVKPGNIMFEGEETD
jgi:hypothetical protein